MRLPVCVLSARWKYTSCPAVSTTAIATGHAFFLASASPAAAIFLACSRGTFGPYWGTCACTTAAAQNAAAPARPANLRTVMGLLRADGVVEGDVGMAPAMRRRDH